MQQVKLTLNEAGNGRFFIEASEATLAEMVVAVSDKIITIYHTEVFEKGEGTGLGKQLLEGVADYAEKNGLNIIPLCSYVLMQFKRNPEKYAGVWSKS